MAQLFYKKNASFYLLAPSIYSAVEDFTHLLHFTPGFLKLYIKFHTSIVRGAFQRLFQGFDFLSEFIKFPGYESDGHGGKNPVAQPRRLQIAPAMKLILL